MTPPPPPAASVSAPASHRHAFPWLDGARGVAALAVVGFHAAAALKLHAVFEFAFLGVDFFFLLSGFVLGHAYAARLAEGGFLGRFALVRFVRLYPMVVMGTLLGFVAMTPPDRNPGDLVMSLLLLPKTSGAPGALVFPIDPPLWSLCFELAANLVFALTVRRAGPRVLLAVCAVSLPLVALGGSLHVGWQTSSFLWGFPRTALSFSLGLLLYRLHAAGRLPRLAWASRAAPLVLASLFAFLMLPLPLAHGRFPILLAEVVFLFPALLAVLAQAKAAPAAAAVCRWAGETSYPLYALHVPLVQAAAAAALSAHVDGVGRVVLMFVLIASMTALGALAARIIDAPARRWLGARLLSRRGVTAPAALPAA